MRGSGLRVEEAGGTRTRETETELTDALLGGSEDGGKLRTILESGTLTSSFQAASSNGSLIHRCRHVLRQQPAHGADLVLYAWGLQPAFSSSARRPTARRSQTTYAYSARRPFLHPTGASSFTLHATTSTSIRHDEGIIPWLYITGRCTMYEARFDS
ncbi:hypothetical protein OH77DRAFT_1420926 [Trametes cingulata]|nr:hypothetical protein OH77DRAFT_1420926 [Trametes cingulata]